MLSWCVYEMSRTIETALEGQNPNSFDNLVDTSLRLLKVKTFRAEGNL